MLWHGKLMLQTEESDPVVGFTTTDTSAPSTAWRQNAPRRMRMVLANDATRYERILDARSIAFTFVWQEIWLCQRKQRLQHQMHMAATWLRLEGYGRGPQWRAAFPQHLGRRATHDGLCSVHTRAQQPVTCGHHGVLSFFGQSLSPVCFPYCLFLERMAGFLWLTCKLAAAAALHSRRDEIDACSAACARGVYLLRPKGRSLHWPRYHLFPAH